MLGNNALLKVIGTILESSFFNLGISINDSEVPTERYITSDFTFVLLNSIGTLFYHG